MQKLMNANLFHLRKNKLFLITIASMLAFNLVNVLNGVRQIKQAMGEFGYTLDHYFFGFLPLVGLFIGSFTCLFQGTEYSDGTLRNKLMVGHTRTRTYLAAFLTNSIAAVAITVVAFLINLVGVPTLGWLKMSVFELITYCIASFLMAIAWAALFTALCMLISNKAYSVAICLLAWLAITFIGSYLYNALCEPEMQAGAIVTANGIQMSEPILNPEYIEGFKRQVYEYLADFFPSSQGIAMSNLSAAHPIRMMLNSIFLIVIITISGLKAFCRKDIK